MMLSRDKTHTHWWKGTETFSQTERGVKEFLKISQNRCWGRGVPETNRAHSGKDRTKSVFRYDQRPQQRHRRLSTLILFREVTRNVLEVVKDSLPSVLWKLRLSHMNISESWLSKTKHDQSTQCLQFLKIHSLKNHLGLQGMISAYFLGVLIAVKNTGSLWLHTRTLLLYCIVPSPCSKDA